ncbi:MULTISPECIES: hypothetical protein [Micrococcaceae]|uniref:hypothetical protein n=1 Tax=unclassified Kocuria TaxID=2649579 RepID=UPI0015BFF632|nr:MULTISPECIES: hypothetical protein [unclassified Kocuria]
MTFPAKYPQLNEMELTDDAHDVLIRVLRVAFPHPAFPDGPYERTAAKILVEAKESTWFRVALTQGLLTLSQLAGGDFRNLDDDAATSVLRRIEATAFFGFIRRTTVLNLYDDPEVWEVLGYEGPSFDKGGYINRGFNDLDWLPEPRIEIYDGEPLPDIAPNAVLAATGKSPTGGQQTDTSNQPGSQETVMRKVSK